MTDSNSLLSLYEELVQNHASQFDSEIASLQQLVKTRMQELRGLEQTLVEAQTTELKRITNALATDARCLLATPGLKTFVQELK
jgi:UDP-N-acetylglucosamine transferase subunit ALG13